MTARGLSRQPWPVYVGLAALFLPWLHGGAAALNLNFRDLAEWCSLNPLSRQADLALGASLGLRLLPLYLLALWLQHIQPRVLVRIVVTLLLALSLLPPPEFFAGDLGDPNYRQMTLVALVVVPVGLVAGRRPFAGKTLRTTLPLLAIATAWLSLSAALDLQYGLAIQASAGPGFLLFALAMLACLLQTVQIPGATLPGRPENSPMDVSG